MTIPAYTFAIRSYSLLTKPGIMLGNAITVAGGYFLAARGEFSLWLFLASVVGLSLLIGSSCVFNNYIDRAADAKMARTKNRALATGSISVKSALLFAIVLGVLGLAFLGVYTNLLTVGIALFGFFVYVILYSFSKYYSMHGTLVGSIAGAVPPIVGYTAVSDQLDIGSFILFAILTLWQMPHFFAIAIFRQNDYAAASIPVLPIVKGMRTTKIHMLVYCVVFLAISPLLTVFGFTGYGYFALAVVLSLGWIGLALKGFSPLVNDLRWARKMFAYSLVVITSLSIAMMMDYQ
jgi:protoheme IX farnesyltransferase